MRCLDKTLYCNGRVVTLDAADTHCSAVLVAGDRIEAVGELDELRALGGPGLNEVDLQGKVLYPGFIDTHSHVDLLAAWCSYAYCGGTPDLASALAILREHATKSGHELVMGYGFDDTAIVDQRGPTLAELDELFPDRPVLLTHISIHAAYVNSHMFRLLGISPTEPSDNIDVVCVDGRPNGTITETLVMTALGKLPPMTLSSMKEGLLTAVEHYNSQGLTATIGGGAGLSGLSPYMVIRALTELEAEGKLNLHAHLPVHGPFFKEIYEAGLMSGPGSPLVRVAGMKLLTDGSIQAYTAAVPEGYLTRPDVKPATIIPQDQLDEYIYEAHSHGQQVVVHGNGNGAIESIITAVERAQARCPRKDPRHLLIHCQMASDEHLARMKAVGMWPSFFGLHVWNWGDRHLNIFLGPERSARIDPCGSAVRLGMPISLHADTPVLPQMTMRSIHTVVNRITSGGVLLGPEQRIDVLEGLRAYTTYAAAMCFEEHRRGSIEPSKVADMVLLDADPREVDPLEIASVKVLSTISMGRHVWGCLK